MQRKRLITGLGKVCQYFCSRVLVEKKNSQININHFLILFIFLTLSSSSCFTRISSFVISWFSWYILGTFFIFPSSTPLCSSSNHSAWNWKSFLLVYLLHFFLKPTNWKLILILLNFLGVKNNVFMVIQCHILSTSKISAYTYRCKGLVETNLAEIVPNEVIYHLWHGTIFFSVSKFWIHNIEIPLYHWQFYVSTHGNQNQKLNLNCKLNQLISYHKNKRQTNNNLEVNGDA